MTMDKLISTCLKNYDTAFFYKVVHSPRLNSIRIIGVVEGLHVCTTLNFTGEDYDEFYLATVLDSADRKFPVHEIIDMFERREDVYPGPNPAKSADFNYEEYHVPLGRTTGPETLNMVLHNTYADNFLKAIEETSKFTPLKRDKMSRPNLANSWVHLDLGPHRDHESPISVISTDGHRLHLANIAGNSIGDIRSDIYEILTPSREPNIHKIPVPCSLITALKPTVAIDSLVLYPDGGDVTFLAGNRVPVKISWSKGHWREMIPNHLPLLLSQWDDYPSDTNSRWLEDFCYEWADIGKEGRVVSQKHGDSTIYWWRWASLSDNGVGIHSSRSCDPDDNVLDDWNIPFRKEAWQGEGEFDEHKRHCHAGFRGKYCYELAKLHEKRTKEGSIDGPTYMLWLGDDENYGDNQPLRVCWNDVYGGGRMHLLMAKRVIRPDVPKAVRARAKEIT